MNTAASPHPANGDIPDVLIRNDALSTEDLTKAEDLVRQSGQSLRVVLDRLGLVGQRDWATAAAQAFGYSVAALDAFPQMLPKDDRLSLDYMRRNAIAPIAIDETRAVFAVADPANQSAHLALKLAFGDALEVFVATDRDIEAAYLRNDEAEAQAAPLAGDASVGLAASKDALVELANDAPTIKFVDNLLAKAIEQRATDIHLEPMEARARVRLRRDGILSESEAPGMAQYAGVVSRLKILANLDIAERRIPQDGRIRHRADGRAIDIRVATAPTVYGEAITLRLLDGGAGLGTLSDLAMPARAQQIYASALKEPNGLILVTGPTGSGKTTTLHAALSSLNDIGRKIVTIENPVEIRTPGLIQLEVNTTAGWSFADALRSILRHDPDVLMVGEIRDAETAELAVRAALTGHLVLSTLHTNRAAEALTRMVNMGVPDYLLSSVLRMAAAQRLVRVLCQDCARPVRLTPEAKSFATYQKLRALDADLPPVEEWSLRVPGSCDKCHGTGYSGRKALFETLTASEAERSLSGAPTRARTMGLEGLGLVARGETTLTELIRVMGNPTGWG